MAASPKRPMISATAAAGLLDLLDAAGVNRDAVLRPAGLRRAALTDRDGFIPCAAFASLLEECARATKDECFGLHFGERFNPKDVGPLAYVLINSPTMEAGFQNAGRYLSVHNQAAKVSIDVEGRFAYARHVLAGSGMTCW